MITLTLELDGPLFDPRKRQTVFEDIEMLVIEGVAFGGMNLIRQRTNRFKNPTGFWKSRITTREATAHTDIINPTIYTNWLEGVSPRNRSSSFKGYHLFEDAEKALAKVADQIADDIVNTGLKRLQ